MALERPSVILNDRWYKVRVFHGCRQGPTRRIVGLEIHGETLAANEEPWKVLRNKERIGRLTSCIYSPRLKKNIGLAIVGAEHADIGTKVTVQTPWHKAVATVVETPFHVPKVTMQG